MGAENFDLAGIRSTNRQFVRVDKVTSLGRAVCGAQLGREFFWCWQLCIVACDSSRAVPQSSLVGCDEEAEF